MGHVSMYLVNDIFYSMQGEGANTGRPAIFCRFAQCNLACHFCDTDFQRGSLYSLGGLRQAFSNVGKCKYVVLTGGEPMLFVNEALVEGLHADGYELALETNGTIECAFDMDWVCVSPKAGTKLRQIKGDELKIVYPQDGINPHDFEHLDFRHFSLQPMDGAKRKQNTWAALEYCLENPKWRMSVQAHKYLGIR